MTYFEEDEGRSSTEVIQDKVKMRHLDYTGEILQAWTILAKITPIGYYYKVRCKCDREFVRNITTILKGRSSQCYVCSRKTTWFYKR